jgi:threonylcarbamoyladenosine tRNA methylthiotransferase MtaB
VPVAEVVAQARRLVDNGYLEIVLTGVDATSWGADLTGAPKLGDLVAEILMRVPDLPRLRLSSIDSVEIDTALLDVISSEPRFQPHAHLSLQHGDDMILKRMKRRHLRDQAIAICDDLRARRPDIAIGADLIAGFPTETDEMFANSLSLIEECGLAHVHVFPFSPRPGTPAAKMPQLDRGLVRRRAEALREAAAIAFGRHVAKMRDRNVSVLMEHEGFGRSGQYTPVRLAGSEADGIVAARIIGSDTNGLIGERLDVAAELAGAA